MPFNEQLFDLMDKHLSNKEFAQACATHPNVNVVVTVAQDERVHPDVMRQLAGHKDPGVRAVLSLNPKVPLDVLEKLITQRDLAELVRENIKKELERRRAAQQK